MTREELHALVDAQFDELEALEQQPTFLAFERQFTKVWNKLGQQVLQARVGQPPANLRKKTIDKPGLVL